jgi:hypothetical protein
VEDAQLEVWGGVHLPGYETVPRERIVVHGEKLSVGRVRMFTGLHRVVEVRNGREECQ